MLLLLVIASTVWVFFDAKSIGARKGLTPGMLDMGPGGWAAVCALFWIIGFPLYLYKRGDIKRSSLAANPPPMRAPTSAPSEPRVDNLLQLEKLADLRSKGIITDEEFNAKKKQLLAG